MTGGLGAAGEGLRRGGADRGPGSGRHCQQRSAKWLLGLLSPAQWLCSRLSISTMLTPALPRPPPPALLHRNAAPESIPRQMLL